MRKSEVTLFWDFIRHLLIMTCTFVVTYFLWTRVHWALAVILILPIYIVMLNFFGFLTLPLYYFTPERKAYSSAEKALIKGDTDTALQIMKEYENGKATTSNNDSGNTTVEVGTRKD